MGGVLFIDEAYYLYRQENERDYGQEAIENPAASDGEQPRRPRGDPGGIRGQDGPVLPLQPGDFAPGSRITSIFPTTPTRICSRSARKCSRTWITNWASTGARALAEYIPIRRGQPHFANARSIRNALDRARLRQANRCFAAGDVELTLDQLVTLEAEDIRRSRVFQQKEAAA